MAVPHHITGAARHHHVTTITVLVITVATATAIRADHAMDMIIAVETSLSRCKINGSQNKKADRIDQLFLCHLKSAWKTWRTWMGSRVHVRWTRIRTRMNVAWWRISITRHIAWRRTIIAAAIIRSTNINRCWRNIYRTAVRAIVIAIIVGHHGAAAEYGNCKQRQNQTTGEARKGNVHFSTFQQDSLKSISKFFMRFYCPHIVFTCAVFQPAQAHMN